MCGQNNCYTGVRVGPVQYICQPCDEDALIAECQSGTGQQQQCGNLDFVECGACYTTTTLKCYGTLQASAPDFRISPLKLQFSSQINKGCEVDPQQFERWVRDKLATQTSNALGG
jgi:hypothetical protein